MKLALIIFLLFCKMIFSQINPDTLYQVELTATASSLVTFFNEGRYPGATNNAALGYGFFIRAMWHPGRLLSVGLMSGYSQISSDEFSDSLGILASARLSSIPLQLAVSMQGKNFEIGLGMGPYMMLTQIEYRTTAQGRRYELGVTFFGSYLFTLNNNIFIGPELRVLYLSYRGILSVIPSLSIRFETLRY